ncbi:MAG TPA: PIG-L family deacetylase [Candidatus Brocadiia bacterium]|nr:PIG-L family deacetylase [Candidatus Brocadiia bacterium]
MLKQKVMALGAHADDIEVMFGGTLLKCKDQGYGIVYIMTTNNMSGANSVLQPDGAIKSTMDGPVITMRRRKSECDAACEVLGTKAIHLDHPQRHYYSPQDGRSCELRYGCKLPEGVKPDVPSILTAYEDKASVARLVDLILEHNPACILSHGMADQNIEHVGSALLATTAFWEAVDKGYRGAFLHSVGHYSRFGDSNFKWDTFVDISDYLDAKMALLGKHRCQMPTAHYPDHGHRLLSMRKGVSAGCKAADLYTWVRRFDIPDQDTTEHTYNPLIAELICNTR